MKFLGKDEQLTNILAGNMSLVSGQLLKAIIYSVEDITCVDFELQLMYANTDRRLLLRLKEVQEYSFYYKAARDFYNIETYKLFREKNGFYICFDPFDELAEASDSDQDFVRSNSIEAYFL